MQTRTLIAEEDGTFTDLLRLAAQGPEQTYLLIDGTCRSNAMGAFDLDLDGIDPTVLLNSAKDGTLGESGAFILDLGAILGRIGEDDFMRRFVEPWGLGHGVVLRVAMPITKLKTHLAKFLRLTREDTDQVVFFRFWDARIALPYFAGLAQHPERLAQWMFPRGGPAIRELIFECDTPWPGLGLRPPEGLAPYDLAIRPVLTRPELDILHMTHLRLFDLSTAAALSTQLKTRAPASLSDSVSGAAFVERVRQDAEPYGIKSESGVVRWAILSIALGLRFARAPGFDTNLRALLTQTTVSESEKLLSVADIAHHSTEQRNASILRALALLQDHAGADLAWELQRALPSAFEQGHTLDPANTINHFTELRARLHTAPPRTKAIAIALIGALGFWWPLDPLRQTLLETLCAPPPDDANLAHQIKSLKDEDAMDTAMKDPT